VTTKSAALRGSVHHHWAVPANEEEAPRHLSTYAHDADQQAHQQAEEVGRPFWRRYFEAVAAVVGVCVGL
jgi:hypothetical protein